jgi:hypothetical protein
MSANSWTPGFGRHRIVVSTPRCGRGNPGSNPGGDIFCFILFFGRLQLVFSELRPELRENARSCAERLGEDESVLGRPKQDVQDLSWAFVLKGVRAWIAHVLEAGIRPNLTASSRAPVIYPTSRQWEISAVLQACWQAPADLPAELPG